MRSDIAWSTPDAIYVKEKNLCTELLGHLNLGDMMFLMLCDRIPTPQESSVFNAIAITLVEHGITPSTLAARLTHAGAPEAMQAAVAAGLTGLGSVFVGSMENAAQMLQEEIERASEADSAALLAETIVNRFERAGEHIPGIGHHFHKPQDPRTGKLFEIAAQNGLSGKYVELIHAVAEAAHRRTGRHLPINATGAIAAIGSELGISWRIMRGIGIVARSIGIVAHLREEMQSPIATEVKKWAEREATRHRHPGSSSGSGEE